MRWVKLLTHSAEVFQNIGELTIIKGEKSIAGLRQKWENDINQGISGVTPRPTAYFNIVQACISTNIVLFLVYYSKVSLYCKNKIKFLT